ncbi:MAG: AgmX/PglI C-terminal domain-containing protein [Myxococcaceae bacterium]|nr:AgmX/PglI C-terminal domain-containing protein [Myxococcaceae bacterium]
MSAQPAVLQVVILRDGLLVGTEVFVPGQYVLGSADHAELRLDDATVDATHANLFFQNGKVAIQDAGSSSGVFVNGHRVNACEVRPVDEIACGPFTLKVRVLAQKPAAKGAPPPEVAALLGGAPKAKQGSQSGSPSTVVSPRRMAAAPANPPPAPAAQARPAPHLRAVPPEPAGATETFEIEAEAVPTQLAPIPHKAPPPPPPAVAKAQPHKPAPPPSIAPVKQPPQPPSRAHVEAMEQPTAVQRPPKHGRKRSLPSLPARGEGKGAPRLFFELYWGETRRAAASFGTIKQKKPVIGALDGLEDVTGHVPMWGFNVPAKGFLLAEQKSAGYRVYVPAGAAVEKRGDDGNFYPMQPDALEASGSKKYLTLSDGQAIRMSGDGDMSLVAYVQPPIPKPFVSPLKNIPWLVLFFLALFGGAFGFFVITHPPDEGPDFNGKTVPPVAVRLIAPKPEEKKKIEKKIEKMKEKPEKKVEKAPKKEEPKVVAKAEVKKTFKAIEKISAAGPAMKDILAAVDKLGNGPGKKDAKDYKLSGLIGKAPIANAGLGTFGMGGGGSGGFGTKGLEVLRGKGGGGIGALGAGNIGKGAVGGTVTHATARAISAQGTIDKEAVAKVVNSHLQEVRACYERALLKDPGLAGKIVLEWGISTTGTVTSAKTKSSSMKNASVEGCIMTSLKTWKFPPAKGGNVVISYPFMFNSVGY